jgi:hypothetical protein
VSSKEGFLTFDKSINVTKGNEDFFEFINMPILPFQDLDNQDTNHCKIIVMHDGNLSENAYSLIILNPEKGKGRR